MSLIKRVVENFVPDEFCPDPIPKVVLEALEDEVSPFIKIYDIFCPKLCHLFSIIYEVDQTTKFSKMKIHDACLKCLIFGCKHIDL